MAQRNETPYNVLKPAWHLDRLQDMRHGNQAKPIGIQLILSDLCNQDCYFCAYRSSTGLSSSQFGEPRADGTINHNPPRMIKTSKAYEILRDAKDLGVKSITFTGGGDPTVHPNHLELFDQALDSGLECSLNTNGILFRPGWEDVLPYFTYIRFSVDAATPEEYARIRQTSPYEYHKVLNNITRLVGAVRGVSSCVVGAGYVVTPDNYENLREGVSHLRDTGIQYVRLASLQSTEGMTIYSDVNAVKDSIRSALELETPEFQIVDLFESTQGKRMDDPFCGFQQLVLYIGANLHVYRCCYTAYSPIGDVGDLTEQSLKAWFESDQKWKDYHYFDARDCTTCPLKDKNQVITYLVKTPPHVNFI